MNPYHSIRLQEKANLPNTRLLWYETPKPALYEYSHQEKKRQYEYRTSENPQLKIKNKDNMESLIGKLNNASHIINTAS